MRALRGVEISMVFQDPMTSSEPGDDHWPANDRHTVQRHRSKAEKLARAVSLLERVGIADPPNNSTVTRTIFRVVCASAWRSPWP